MEKHLAKFNCLSTSVEFVPTNYDHGQKITLMKKYFEDLLQGWKI